VKAFCSLLFWMKVVNFYLMMMMITVTTTTTTTPIRLRKHMFQQQLLTGRDSHKFKRHYSVQRVSHVFLSAMYESSATTIHNRIDAYTCSARD